VMPDTGVAKLALMIQSHFSLKLL